MREGNENKEPKKFSVQNALGTFLKVVSLPPNYL